MIRPKKIQTGYQAEATHEKSTDTLQEMVLKSRDSMGKRQINQSSQTRALSKRRAGQDAAETTPRWPRILVQPGSAAPQEAPSIGVTRSTTLAALPSTATRRPVYTPVALGMRRLSRASRWDERGEKESALFLTSLLGECMFLDQNPSQDKQRFLRSNEGRTIPVIRRCRSSHVNELHR